MLNTKAVSPEQKLESVKKGCGFDEFGFYTPLDGWLFYLLYKNKHEIEGYLRMIGGFCDEEIIFINPGNSNAHDICFLR